MRSIIWLAIGASCGIGLGAYLAWTTCRSLYGRKLVAAATRLHKADQGRLQAHQLQMQARQQVESLKAELETLQRKTSVSALQAARAESMARQISRELEQERIDAMQGAQAADTDAHGFADTQVLR